MQYKITIKDNKMIAQVLNTLFSYINSFFKKNSSSINEEELKKENILINEELEFEKKSGYSFYIFRTNFDYQRMKNIKEDIGYIKTCGLDELNIFFKKAGFENFIEKKTSLKWHYDSYPVFYLDFFNQKDSNLIEVNSKTFKVDDGVFAYSPGIEKFRVTVPDYETYLKQLQKVAPNNNNGNGFLVFVTKTVGNISIKIKMLKREIEKVDNDINTVKSIHEELNKSNNLILNIEADQLKTLAKIKTLKDLKNDKIRLENELLILEKLFKNEKDCFTRN